MPDDNRIEPLPTPTKSASATGGYDQYDQQVLAHERTLLAAERTFLAWIRTGLTSIGIGIAMARFIIFKSAGHQIIGHRIGQILILWGIGVFIFSLISYRRSCQQLSRARPSQGAITCLTLAAIILILISLTMFWIVVE